MDHRNERPDPLAGAFAELRSASLRQVPEPDPDEPRRRAYRRLRNRAVVPGVAAAVVVAAGGLGLVRPLAAPPPPAVTGTSPATDLPSAWPSSTAATPAPSRSPTAPASPSATPSGTASPGPTSARPSGSRPAGTPPASSTRFVDLSISAPRSITLTPSGGRYTGWLDLTMGNAGTRAYDAGDLIVVLPVEATINLDGTNIGGCFNQGQTDDTKTMYCTGDGPIPAGGTRSYRIGVVVNIAPGGSARTLTGCTLTVRANVRGSFPADRTPTDNTARTGFQLPAG